jgi:predicted phosphodiesterase
LSGIVKDWQEDAITLDRTGIFSRREIAKLLGVPRSTVLDFLRKYFEVKNEPKEIDYNAEVLTDPVRQYNNSRILFISDMHIPYHHQGLLPFLEGLKKRYEPTRVICLGDELDKHAMSFHDSDPDLPSAGDELNKALPVIKELEKLFPEMDLIDSNHGSMVYRKAKHHGIPRRYIRGYNDVLGVGDGWKWHMDLTIELPDGQKVYIHHGKTADALRTSQGMGMSHVAGHYHERFNVQYWANPVGLYFAMNCGCLVDDNALAFSYNNVNLKRPIVGTGLIIDGYPVLEPMPL